MSDKWLDEYSGQTADELLAMSADHRKDSIVLAFEAALDQKADRLGLDALTDEERVVLAVEGLEREVNNGGYDQFFGNSSSQHAAVVVDALKRIGCPDVAALTQRAIDCLGISTLTVEAIEDVIFEEDEEREQVLHDCDSEYYEKAGCLAEPLFEFIRQNAARITLK